MKPVETLVLLMCVVIGVVLMGRRLKIPYPIALVMGGLEINLIPGLPPVRIHPDIIFLVFLPPLLYAPRGSRRCMTCLNEKTAPLKC